MFDARQLLEQVMGTAQPGGQAQARQSQAHGGQGTGANGHLLTGALVGGALGVLAGNKRARKVFGKTAETATELYPAALLAMDPDTMLERKFLTQLQIALRLDVDLAA